MVAVVLLLVVGWAGVVAARATIKQREVMALRNQARTELNEVQEKQQHLTQKIEFLSTDYGIDQEIKNQYRVAKPDEQVVIIVPKDQGSETEESGASEDTWWRHVRNFIGL